MKPMRSIAVILLLIAAVFSLAPSGAAIAGGAGPELVLAAADAPVADDAAPARKAPGLIDPKSVFFGCATGTVLGALVTALPPMVGWTFYAGALPAVVALVATSGVGCAVGLFGGVIVSAFAWMFDKIGGAWHAVFG